MNIIICIKHNKQQRTRNNNNMPSAQDDAAKSNNTCKAWRVVVVVAGLPFSLPVNTHIHLCHDACMMWYDMICTKQYGKVVARTGCVLHDRCCKPVFMFGCCDLCGFEVSTRGSLFVVVYCLLLLCC